jgi:hypothetical protein
VRLKDFLVDRQVGREIIEGGCGHFSWHGTWPMEGAGAIGHRKALELCSKISL